MASKYWLKLYHEMLDDPKVMTLRPALRWRFIETLLVAGEMDEGGYLPPLDKYAWRVRDRMELVETELNELSDAGLLSREDGQWFVTKFAERQEPVKAAERMRRMRKRKKKREYYGDDTTAERDRYDTVTKRNTDTDKDTDKELDKSAREDAIAQHEADANGQSQERLAMISAIDRVVKPVYMPGFNGDDFERVAARFLADGVTVEQVEGFSEWWQKHGHYEGKPAVRSLVNEWGNYRDGVSGSVPDINDTGDPRNWKSEGGVL